MIVVMTFNDDLSASRPPPSSPSILSKFAHQFKSPILLSAETHSLPSGVAPFRRGDGHGCERDGEHGGLLGGRAEHPRVRAAVGGEVGVPEWARAASVRHRQPGEAADHRD